MSFFRIQATLRPLANRPDSCKVSLTRQTSRRVPTENVELRIGIGSNVLDAMGAVQGDHVALLWGRDEHCGKVRLIKAEAGRLIGKLKPGKEPFHLLLFRDLPTEPIPGRDDRLQQLELVRRPAVQAKWEPCDGGGVLITLPAGWWTIHGSAASRRALTALVSVPMPAVVPAEVA